MAVQIQLRRDLAATWLAVNPTLAQGELGIETNTGLAKMGNGTDDWVTLPYWPAGGGGGHDILVDGVAMPTEPGLHFTGVEGEDDAINGWTIIKVPRQVTTVQRIAMSPVYGYTVFDTDALKLFVYNGTAWEML